MTILVVDAQGGGLGRALVEKLKQARIDAEIIGVGTNVQATAALLKAGADGAATGENAVVYNAAQADIITGGTGIICANAMLGEISPAMAAAVSQSEAVKVLIPLNQCKLRISGLDQVPLPVKVDNVVQDIVKLVEQG